MPNTSTLSKTKHVWFVLCVSPNTERKATQFLQRAGFETCLPMRRVRSKCQKRKLDSVIFKNYVFAACPPKDYRKLFVDKCIRRILPNAGKHATLRDSEINLIRSLEANEEAVAPLTTPTVGEKVRIKTGDFIGLVGKVASRHEHNARVCIEIPCLQRVVPLHIAEEDLEKI